MAEMRDLTSRSMTVYREALEKSTRNVYRLLGGGGGGGGGGGVGDGV